MSWKGQSQRHRRAKLLGKAGGRYATPKKRFKRYEPTLVLGEPDPTGAVTRAKALQEKRRKEEEFVKITKHDKILKDYFKNRLSKEDDFWSEHKDFKYKQKNLGKDLKIELLYGTERGGQINIWESGKSDLEHIWTTSDDKKFHKIEEVGFMDWKNAKEEFSNIKTQKDVVDLMWRNQ